MPLALLKYDGQNTNLNTPHRTAHSVQTQGTQRVADIMFAVDEELTGNFQFVETEQFLGNFFSVGDEIVESTEKKLRDDGLLDQITSFGSSASCEKELYEPFTEVANTILCCTPEELDIGSYWASQPNKAPNNLDDLDDKAVKPRPDAVGALGDHRAFFKAIILLKRGDAEMTDKTEVARLIVDYAASCIRYHGEFKGLSQNELLTQVQEIREKLQQDSNYSPDKILSEAKTLLQNCQLKKSSKQEVKEPNEILTRHTYSTIQKCVKFLHSSTPLQQAHQAVLDAGESRRKTLTPPELSKLNKVASIWWLRVVTPVEIKLKSDKKSKQEGSSQLANYMRMVMRTQPNRHFVFGLLLCGGHLRVLYCDRSGLLATRSWIDIRKSKYVPSTHPCVQIKDYGISAYDTEWAIQVPDSQGQNGKWYGTNSPPLILKQGWHRVGGPTEKEFHDKEGNDSTNADDTLHHVGTILSSVQVSALTATFDSKELGASPVDKATFRGGIQGKAAEWERGVVDPEQIGEKRAAVSSHFPFAVRVLVRTLMLTYGWPIKYFKDLKELVRTIRDAVQGHRDLYFNRLVLHRDVSAGNILICPNGDDVEDTTGCIIDLDHAKKALKRITYSDPDVVSKSEFNAIRRQLGKILKFGSIEMDQELTGVLIRYFGDDVQIAFKELVKVYVDNLQDSNNPLTDRVWTSTILPNVGSSSLYFIRVFTFHGIYPDASNVQTLSSGCSARIKELPSLLDGWAAFSWPWNQNGNNGVHEFGDFVGDSAEESSSTGPCAWRSGP
ncbi:hypothetical protein EUX98_g9170 [Antrodiella citrinella]|uniref:Fungal-type protein kinase domain-containing protein n=1 Tax=Antrodiella citrinella TaxID=2447956 RepID=A0A4S4LZE8_9APHY|nr:hypothetical protein EUX98_g9170 [Antrodiella citrinella]